MLFRQVVILIISISLILAFWNEKSPITIVTNEEQNNIIVIFSLPLLIHIQKSVNVTY